MLALGLEDRIVGSAFSDGPVPEELADAASGVEVLSDNVPSQEATLATEPDLVFAGWESNLSAEGAGDRDTLAKLGVASYVAPAACKGEGYMPNPLTFDEVFREFDEAGAIFGVPDAATELVAQQRAELDAIEPNADGLTALWYSSGDDTPYVGAGIGAPQMIMDAAGLENVAADVEDTWTAMGWEAIVAADPDVIVLVDAAWNTAGRRSSTSSRTPRPQRCRAVQQQRYLVVDSRRPRRACATSARWRRSSTSWRRSADDALAAHRARPAAGVDSRHPARRHARPGVGMPPRNGRRGAGCARQRHAACARERGRWVSPCCSGHPSSWPSPSDPPDSPPPTCSRASPRTSASASRR